MGGVRWVATMTERGSDKEIGGQARRLGRAGQGVCVCGQDGGASGPRAVEVERGGGEVTGRGGR